MKIKVNEQLKGIDGKPIVNGSNPPMTLKEICITSILTPMEGDNEQGKYKKYEIYIKLRDAKVEADLSIEDLAIIKKGIGKFQPPLILGQCFDLLEK